jgi:Phosphopantetheine attachment site
MQELGFFMSLCVVGLFAYVVGGLFDARRRALRRSYNDAQQSQSDREFEVGISALNPVPVDFGATFRKAVGAALGLEPQKLGPQDRILRDLRVFGFDAMELASALERAFDVRVRVVDIVRAGTLRKLALLVHERAQEISEHEPPLHRDPIPKVQPPKTDSEQAGAEPAPQGPIQV